ncbi:MAG TPA: TolC family protein [Aquifex aeolicus]|uniref:TolC family protein n=1 Tax=Aquifex aeolicus TaxID=63363 RepID=A0A9D0YNV4_AQUAO|nr:TolC family protein [Aquificales bacterium]HIP86672.1 TolC family protein [Aquifex sp.]HIP97798.1 TolC family protein [Aquifex aeolicus]HIQ26360.1 TolC family protein [Aquifex aeolicus]
MKRVLLIGLLFSASLTARELTLKEAVDIALKKNLELKAEKYKVSQKRYQYEAFKGYLFPQMSLSYFFMRTNQPPYSIMFRMNTHSLQFPRPSSLTVGGLAKAFLDMESYFNNPGSNQIYDLALRVEIPLWMGGKVRNALKGKFFEWKAQELISQRKEEEVAYSVADTFFKILYAKQALRATETALKDIKHHLKLVDRMHKAGLALYSDLLRVKVYYESVKAKNEEAKNNFFIAKKALALMLNQNWNPENLTLKGELQCPSPQKVEKDFKKLLKWFVDSRKDLVALKEGITAINFYKKATWGNYLPDFVAFGEYHLYDNNRFGNFVANSYMVGVGFQWKLFDGLNAFNKVRMLKEKERELETTLEYAQKGIKFELTRAVKEYQTAYAKYREALAKIEQAEESLKIVTARYKQGLARIVDLLDVQAQLDKARFERAKALYGCIKAYLKLYNTAGKIWEVLK